MKNASIKNEIEAALVRGDFTGFREHLSPDVIWGDCTSPDTLITMVEGLQALGLKATAIDVVENADRIIVHLSVESPDQGSFSTHHAMFMENGLIVEIVDAPTAETVHTVERLGPFLAGDQAAKLRGIAPVLPVRSVEEALVHYGKLGFATSSYGGDADYGYLKRNGVQLHLTQVPNLDPAASNVAVYLFVDDARALYAQWRDANVGGRIIAPTDTDYGLCEGAHIDPDGNLIRFGSDL